MMIDIFFHAAFLLQDLKYLKEDSAIKDEQFAAEVATVVLLAGSCEVLVLPFAQTPLSSLITCFIIYWCGSLSSPQCVLVTNLCLGWPG